MRRLDVQTGTALIAALAAGFLIALAIFGTGSDNTTTTVTAAATTGATAPVTTTVTGVTETTTTAGTTGTTTTPVSPQPSTVGCIRLWNQATNRAAQTFMTTIASQQPVRIHVGRTTEVPPKCLVTVLANDGSAYVFSEGGGQTYPYTPTPSRTTSAALPASQRKANALERRDGTLQAR
jgi:hypothetical protein